MVEKQKKVADFSIDYFLQWKINSFVKNKLIQETIKKMKKVRIKNKAKTKQKTKITIKN